MVKPPWIDLAQVVSNADVVRHAKRIPRVMEALSKLQEWSRLYTPPCELGDLLRIISCLGSTLAALLRQADGKWLEANWQCAVCLLQTTAVFTHKVYDDGDQNVHPSTAHEISECLVEAGLLDQLPTFLKRAAQLIAAGTGGSGAGATATSSAAAAANSSATATTAACSPQLMCCSFALLQLCEVMNSMWPAIMLADKDAATIVAPAAQLAVSLLQAAGQQQQISAGVRTEVILQESLKFTWKLVQHLQALQTLGMNTSEFEDLASHHFGLLLLVLLEVQIQHLQDTAPSSAAAAAGFPDQPAGAAACVSKIAQGQQQHWGQHSAGAFVQQYCDSLLQALGLPTGQQQWEHLCRTASSCCGSSWSAAEICSTTLQIVASFLSLWFVTVARQWDRTDKKNGLVLSQQHCGPLQSVLSQLQGRLLCFAAMSMPIASNSSDSSSSNMYGLCTQAVEVAAKAVAFRLVVEGPAPDKAARLHKQPQLLPVLELLHLSALLLNLAAATAQAADSAGTDSSSSIVRNVSSLTIGDKIASILRKMVSSSHLPHGQAEIGIWRSKAHLIAAALERWCRAAQPAAAAVAALTADNDVYSSSSKLCAKVADSTSQLLYSAAPGSLRPMSVVLVQDGIGRDALFSLLLSFTKLLSSLQDKQELEQLYAFGHRVCGTAVIVCRQLLGQDSSSSDSDDSSRSSSELVPLGIAPWVVLWARNIAALASLLPRTFTEFMQAAAALGDKHVDQCEQGFAKFREHELKMLDRIVNDIHTTTVTFTRMMDECCHMFGVPLPGSSSGSLSSCSGSGDYRRSSSQHDDKVNSKVNTSSGGCGGSHYNNASSSGGNADDSCGSDDDSSSTDGDDGDGGSSSSMACSAMAASATFDGFVDGLDRSSTGRWQTASTLSDPAVHTTYWLTYAPPMICRLQPLLTRLGQQGDMLHRASQHAKCKWVSKDSNTQQQPELNVVYTARTPLQLAKAVEHLTDERLYKQLAEVAKDASMLPLPHCCNNMGCNNMAGESELQLVGGKGCMCAGCKIARYCSRSCQMAAWPEHKFVCRQLREAAAKEADAAATTAIAVDAAAAASAAAGFPVEHHTDE